MTKPLFFPAKGTADAIRKKLQAQHPDRVYMVAPRPGGFEVIFGYTDTPTGPFSMPESDAPLVSLGQATASVYENLDAWLGAAPGSEGTAVGLAPIVGLDMAAPGSEGTAVGLVDVDFAAMELKVIAAMQPAAMANTITADKLVAYTIPAKKDLPSIMDVAHKKNPSPHAPKPGTATGDDAMAPAKVLVEGDVVILTLPFRGESKAYVDAFFNGKAISIGRAKIKAYEVHGVQVVMTVDKKFAKAREFI